VLIATMAEFTEFPQFTYILHAEIFDTMLRGAEMRGLLETSALRSATEVAEMSGSYPDISIVIRTRNDRPFMEGLFEDIHRQAFSGQVQIVLADTESSDGTVATAMALGRDLDREVTVVPIAQRNFSYPIGLNQAFDAVDNPYILSLVGHERLSNTRTLDAAIRGSRSPNFGGAYGPALPNINSTRSERLGAIILGIPGMLKGPQRLAGPEVGALASDRAVISRDAWRELGGYDIAYGAGGEDGDLARRMSAAGIDIVRDPVLATHHTHGLGPVRSLVQVIDWYRISRPHEFRPQLHRFIRPEEYHSKH
jgi:glycosyltransferase involved in cell wall biosynthesis